MPLQSTLGLINFTMAIIRSVAFDRSCVITTIQETSTDCNSIFCTDSIDRGHAYKLYKVRCSSARANFFACSAQAAEPGGGQTGSCPQPPLADKGELSNVPPHFADLVQWCLQARKNIGTCRWKCVKYYQKCVKFACNYFNNSSNSGGLCPQTPYRGSTPGPHWGTSFPQTSVVLPHPKAPSATFVAQSLMCGTVSMIPSVLLVSRPLKGLLRRLIFTTFSVSKRVGLVI